MNFLERVDFRTKNDLIFILIPMQEFFRSVWGITISYMLVLVYDHKMAMLI